MAEPEGGSVASESPDRDGSEPVDARVVDDLAAAEVAPDAPAATESPVETDERADPGTIDEGRTDSRLAAADAQVQALREELEVERQAAALRDEELALYAKLIGRLGTHVDAFASRLIPS